MLARLARLPRGRFAPGAAPLRQAALVGRFLGALTIGASLLALLWTVLPHDGAEGDGLVRAMVAIGLAAGVMMLAGAIDHAPPWVPQVAVVLLQVVISVGYLAPGVADNDLRLLYVWAVPVAAFFFSTRAAIAQGAFSALCLAVCLLLTPEPAGVLLRVWLMTIGTSTALAVVVGMGVGSARRSRRALRHLAWHDDLSGLPNRVLLERRVREALLARDLDGGHVHVMLVDVDRFKLVNDSYGHPAGDALITAVAQRLLAVVGPRDTVARTGGDEFAVLVVDPGQERLPGLLERLAEGWEQPVQVGGALVHVSASVGVTTCETSGETPDSLLRDADVALYRAKQTRRGSVRRFDASLREAAARRARLTHDLHGALDRGQLWLAYQPVVELDTGRTVAAEALLRWDHPELGAVPPGEFVPLVEDSGLIVRVGRFVLEQTAQDLAAWRRAAVVGDGFSVAVNVSVRQLDDDFPDLLTAVRRAHGLPADSLSVEVTETVLMEGVTSYCDVLGRLRAVGTRVALDDFGTGYSSLSYLQRLPLDCLKIDRAFVSELDGERPRVPLVKAVVDLASSLGMQVVAEGVETIEQRRQLRWLGVHLAQGYLFSRPLRAGELVRHLVGELSEAGRAGRD